MPPSSGELWGHHLMPLQVDMDCLLPTGVIIVLKCNRDATLEQIKANLWSKAKEYPLHYLLHDSSSYIFVSITQDAEREEFYDETRRLCDLRLFQPILKVVEPKGNREEKMLNYDIGIAIGMPINDFNEMSDLEVMTFRRNIMYVCNDVVEEMRVLGDHGRAVHTFPPEIHSSAVLPKHLIEKIQTNENLLVCIWVVSANGDKQKYTVKVPFDSTPSEVIAEAIRYRTTKLNMAADQQLKCIKEYKDSYVLKVCGCQNYLLEQHPLTQYKYIRKCIARDRIPQLMLMSREGVYANLPKHDFSFPSYVMKGQGALQDINSQQTSSLWSIEDMLRIQIKCATKVSARDIGKLYVRAGIYHGTEPLCSVRNTKQVEASNPKWNQWLDFDLYIPDIPRTARLCLSLCSVSKKGKKRTDIKASFKKVHYAVAWGNVNLFDFNNRMQTDKVSLHLWPIPQGLDDLLNTVGVPGSNPNTDTQCLELEFENYGKPVSFPDEKQIEEYAQWIENRSMDPIHNRGSTTYTPSAYPTSNHTNSLADALNKESLLDIIQRDPLSEISEQEKEMLWRQRKICLQIPSSLPKLLMAVKWNSREDVATLYMLLKQWPVVSPEVCLELLNCLYTDLTVRMFAVRCLDETITDDLLSQYLLQLVQVLKFEPYIENHLIDFLLRRCLKNQTIGHFFFWHLKSEMHNANMRTRFGLILEAFCRGCGSYLKTIVRQVEAIEKLTKLTDALKEEKEDNQLKVLVNHVQQADYLDALQNFPSPLNHSNTLGDLMVDKCTIKKSKKKPLWLVWQNPDPMADVSMRDFKILFKNGDDLRQDMLTLQIIRIMDYIWQSEGLDLRMIPYGCLSTGLNVGMIEVVQEAKTVMKIQTASLSGGIQLNSRELHKWIKDKNKEKEKYEMAIEAFTKSCAGYCVATFVLGIGDRHPDNIMVNEDGQVFHIDFGHFLDHRKKKFGINRERVPFVLTEDFIRVIAKDRDNPKQSKEFREFNELCGKAYVYLRRHAGLFVTLFAMMLSCGIPELQSLDDVEYIRKTLQVEKSDKDALEYFQKQFYEAYGGSWTTKLDWLAHYLKTK